jgi:hypothetical protein
MPENDLKLKVFNVIISLKPQSLKNTISTAFSSVLQLVVFECRAQNSEQNDNFPSFCSSTRRHGNLNDN